MRKTGFLFDRRFLLHETGPYHPEVPERLNAIYNGIQAAGLLEQLTLIQAVPAEMKWIETVHSRDYIDRFGDACVAGKNQFCCPDNQMCRDTYDTAMLAVGGVLRTVKMMMEGTLDNAFCAVRPPGHHAEAAEAMGFCYFNNVAVAARYLQQQWGIQKVAIIDFDVHHGNGTQHIFENDATVYYYSIHEHPSFAYPGTGREFESGSGSGYGFTRNSPALPGQDDAEYQRLITRDLLPAMAAFKPEVILVSCGFDAHEDDDMSNMRVSTAGFTWIMEQIVRLADTHCRGRLVSVLEGGYSLERLPELAANHVKILLQD